MVNDTLVIFYVLLEWIAIFTNYMDILKLYFFIMPPLE